MLTFGRFEIVSNTGPQRRRVDVQLRVPARHVVHAARETVEVLDARGPAAIQVESHGAHAGGVQLEDFLVGDGRRNLDDAGERGPEFCERVVHVLGLRALERTGDHRAALDAEAGYARAVIIDGENRRQETLVLHHGKTRVDDMEVRVEDGRHGR